jgi:hypothetical protein
MVVQTKAGIASEYIEQERGKRAVITGGGSTSIKFHTLIEMGCLFNTVVEL